MKIECPCKDCTPETGRSLTCHNVETCERWAKYQKQIYTRNIELRKSQAFYYTKNHLDNKRNSSKRGGQGARHLYTKGW